MRKYLLFIFSTIAGIFIFSDALGQSRILVSRDTEYHYFSGTSEPDPYWYLPGFDDSGWTVDTGYIGYGYDREDVLIADSASSIYLRYRIQIDNPSDFHEANFFADFDDGYIAYLNGKEIVRVNLDKSASHFAFNDLTIRSHAIQTYNWDPSFPMLGYYLDSLQLDSCLVQGENILAVHILNDSLEGSDLQFRLNFYDITRASYNFYSIVSRYKDQVELDSTDLPLFVIETDEWGIPYKNRRRKAFMGIIDNEDGSYNHATDSCNVYYGDVSIEVRGQSSSEFPKRTYRFEFIDSLEADSNVALLGLPADDDWILMGPFHDKAQFRNPMVFDMGHKLNGSYQPRTRFCDLIYNGEYLGLYTLVETIKRNEGRLNIARLRESEISGNDLTGGYIIRYDKPNGDLQIDYPKEDEIQDEQRDYILGFMSRYFTALNSRQFMDPDSGFRKFINDTSLVDYLIVNEITKNADSYLFSTYMYKDRDDRDPRLHFGPLWDYDLAFGNSIFQQGDRTDGWQFDNGTNTRLRVTKLFQDEALVDLFQERWYAAREGCFHTDSLFAYIDSTVAVLDIPQRRNYQVWPVIDKDLFYPNYRSMSYEEEIWNIKNWMTARLDWIDNNIGNIYYPVVMPESTPDTIEDLYFRYDLYPNPFSSELILDVNVAEETEMGIELFDVTGRLRYGETFAIGGGFSQQIIQNSKIQDLARGVYLVRISLNGSQAGIQRVVKQ